MSAQKVSLDVIETTTVEALIRHGASRPVADSVAQAVRVAEGRGNLICGLFYLESYCQQLETGRVNGTVEPVVTRPKGSTVQVNAGFGFAQPAFDAGLPVALAAAREMGLAALSIHHSHTCTSMGFFTEQIATKGMIGIGMTNAPACVAPPGGSKPVLGTNPISMAVPSSDGRVAFAFDQSTSATAIGKVRVAASKGEQVPEGWIVDGDGNPTTEPKDMASLVSSGGYKGFGFGLMAEILAAGLTGSVLSTEAAPLKTPNGPPHDLGQFYMIIDPDAYGVDLSARINTLADSVERQPGARLPGRGTRLPASVNVDDALWAKTLKLAGMSG